jgi:hypothetical protein
MRSWRKATEIGIFMWIFVFVDSIEDLNGETEPITLKPGGAPGKVQK